MLRAFDVYIHIEFFEIESLKQYVTNKCRLLYLCNELGQASVMVRIVLNIWDARIYLA